MNKKRSLFSSAPSRFLDDGHAKEPHDLRVSTTILQLHSPRYSVVSSVDTSFTKKFPVSGRVYSGFELKSYRSRSRSITKTTLSIRYVQRQTCTNYHTGYGGVGLAANSVSVMAYA